MQVLDQSKDLDSLAKALISHHDSERLGDGMRFFSPEMKNKDAAAGGEVPQGLVTDFLTQEDQGNLRKAREKNQPESSKGTGMAR